MPAVSSVKGFDSSTRDLSWVMKDCASGACGTMTMPGLVQNWPAPRVTELNRFCASCWGALSSAPGNTKTGLPLDISVKQGMGTGRAAHTSISVRPALSEPVNAIAHTSGCLTSAAPTSLPDPYSVLNTPG